MGYASVTAMVEVAVSNRFNPSPTGAIHRDGLLPALNLAVPSLPDQDSFSPEFRSTPP